MVLHFPSGASLMHHSRFSTVIIDCQTSDLRSAARFWSEAFGRPAVENPGNPMYVALQMRADEIICQVQSVAHESRVHLDIETDDIDAEVARLEALGATRIAFVKRWWVMQAPTGHRFCVVRKQRAEFGPHLNSWD